MSQLGLSGQQSAIVFAQKLGVPGKIFNCAEVTDFNGTPDLKRLHQAIDQSLNAVTNFQCEFSFAENELATQSYKTQTHFTEVLEVEEPSDIEQFIKCDLDQTYLREDLQNIEATSLIRSVLFTNKKNQNVSWYLRIHHILVDGYGFESLRQTAIRTYRAPAFTAKHLPLSEQLTATEQASQSYENGPQKDADITFWQHLYQNSSGPLDLAPRRKLTEFPIVQSFDLAADAASTLFTDPANWHTKVLAAIATYFRFLSDQNEALLGFTVAGRNNSQLRKVRLPLINQIAIPVNCSQTETIAAFEGKFDNQFQDLLKHQTFPSQEVLHRFLSGSHNPDAGVFGIEINLRSYLSQSPQEDFETKVHFINPGPVHGLSIEINPDLIAGKLQLGLRANPQYISAESLALHARRLQNWIGNYVSAPGDQTISQLRLQITSEQKLIQAFNDTENVIIEQTLGQLLATGFNDNPERVALTWLENGETKSLNYAQLHETVTTRAAGLAALGVQVGDKVALNSVRDPQTVVNILALIWLGAIYVPVDFTAPASRNIDLAQTAQPTFAIHPSKNHPHYDLPGVATIFSAEVQSEGKIGAPASHSNKDGAYVIHTSGSTGKPKGVVVSHHAIVNHLNWMIDYLKDPTPKTYLLKTPLTFDVSVWEVFLPFVTASTMVVAGPDDHREPQILSSLITKFDVDIIHFVPSMLAIFLEEPSAQAALETLDHMICSGEALGKREVELALHKNPKLFLHNYYGPTEAAVDVTFFECHGLQDRHLSVPIGGPAWNTEIRIVSANDQDVAIGQPGELLIGGVQLANEYLNQPLLTQKAFITMPQTPQWRSTRWYRTGDKATYQLQAAGITVEYLGRSDGQVKLHGQRIELEEIDFRLNEIITPKSAGTFIAQDLSGNKVLVAAIIDTSIVGEPGWDLTTSPEYLTQVQAKLPEIMVPKYYLSLPQIPSSAHGKRNIRALQEIFASALHSVLAQSQPVVEELDPQVRQILAIMSQVLQNPALRSTDNFFASGGSSLKAAKLAGILRSELKGFEDLRVADIFTSPTSQRLAQFASATPDSQAGAKFHKDAVIEFRPPTNKTIIALPPAGGLAWCYATLAQHLDGQYGLLALQSPEVILEDFQSTAFKELSAYYLELLQAQNLRGEIILLGWSVGGVIAHALAQLALSQSDLPFEITELVLLDSYPSDVWQHFPSPDEAELSKALLLMANLDPDAGAQTFEATLKILQNTDNALNNIPLEQLRRVPNAVLNATRQMKDYRPTPLEVKISMQVASREHTDPLFNPQLWQQYSTFELQVTSHELFHKEMISPTLWKALVAAKF